MPIAFDIDGLILTPGEEASHERLREAGFTGQSLLTRLFQRRSEPGRLWRARNPRVTVVDEAIEIYPCLDGYLDPDRRWQTACSVVEVEHRIARVTVEVLDGVYAAGNFFERFVEMATVQLGEPEKPARRQALWHLSDGVVRASYDRHGYNAVFSLEDGSASAMQGEA